MNQGVYDFVFAEATVRAIHIVRTLSLVAEKETIDSTEDGKQGSLDGETKILAAALAFASCPFTNADPVGP